MRYKWVFSLMLFMCVFLFSKIVQMNIKQRRERKAGEGWREKGKQREGGVGWESRGEKQEGMEATVTSRAAADPCLVLLWTIFSALPCQKHRRQKLRAFGATLRTIPEHSKETEHYFLRRNYPDNYIITHIPLYSPF